MVSESERERDEKMREGKREGLFFLFLLESALSSDEERREREIESCKGKATNEKERVCVLRGERMRLANRHRVPLFFIRKTRE